MSQWASQSTIIKLVAVSRRLEQMAEHVGELWDDKVLGSKMSTCRLVQQRQREAVQQLSELRVRMQRRGLQSKSAPILNASEQMRVVSELERATKAVIDASAAVWEAVEEALPDASQRMRELRQWSVAAVEGTRSLVTLGRDVSGVPVLGDAWRVARTQSRWTSAPPAARPAFNAPGYFNGPVGATGWSPAAQTYASWSWFLALLMVLKEVLPTTNSMWTASIWSGGVG